VGANVSSGVEKEDNAAMVKGDTRKSTSVDQVEGGRWEGIEPGKEGDKDT
jgi:hypothetical protein